jgi:excisionase family DNA binding protein
MSARANTAVAAVPRLALSVEEACQALGVSWDFWQEHVAHEVRIVRRGRRKLIAVAELQRWLEASGETVLSER